MDEVIGEEGSSDKERWNEVIGEEGSSDRERWGEG